MSIRLIILFSLVGFSFDFLSFSVPLCFSSFCLYLFCSIVTLLIILLCLLHSTYLEHLCLFFLSYILSLSLIYTFSFRHHTIYLHFLLQHLSFYFLCCNRKEIEIHANYFISCSICSFFFDPSVSNVSPIQHLFSICASFYLTSFSLSLFSSRFPFCLRH